MESNLSGLVELVVVVGLLGWFWHSQTAATRKDDPSRGSEDQPPPPPRKTPATPKR